MSRPRRGAWWVVVSAVAYSLFAVFTKDALAEGMRPRDLLVWRFAIATPVAWAVVLLRARAGGPGPTSAPRRAMTALGVLFGLLALMAFIGLDHMPAALYTVVIYTYPTMVAVGAWLLGRPAPLALWGALVLTMFGIALTVPEVFASSDATVTGLIVTLVNAACYAGYILVSSRLIERRRAMGRQVDGLVAATWSLTGSLLFALGVMATGDVNAPSTWRATGGIVGLAVVSTVVAGSTLMIGLQTLSPPAAATIATLEPVLTLTWAVTLLGEGLGAVQVVGAVLVIGGVTWAQRSHRDDPALATGSVLPPDASAGAETLGTPAPQG